MVLGGCKIAIHRREEKRRTGSGDQEIKILTSDLVEPWKAGFGYVYVSILEQVGVFCGVFGLFLWRVVSLTVVFKWSVLLKSN